MSLKFSTTAEIDASFRALHAGFHSGRTLDLTYRRSQLRNLYYAIVDNEAELKEALSQDFYRSQNETELFEIHYVLTEIKLAINRLDTWAKDRPLEFDVRFPKSGALRPTPFGTMLLIGPWNYPYNCTLGPFVSAIAAGNAVMVKPSEMAPNSARIMTYILQSAFDPELVQVVNGGVEETTYVLEKFRFDKIMFTGSPRVGSIVAQAAAKKLTPVALELGGKSPVFVSANSNVALAAKRTVWGKLASGGQTCVAPDYVLVDESVADLFVAEAKLAAEQLYAVDGPQRFRDYTHVVNDRLYRRIVDLVGKTRGKVWQLAQRDDSTRLYPPTIVDFVEIGDPLMAEELFAPVLPVIRVPAGPKFIDSAVKLVVENHDHPLALYIFSDRKDEQKQIISGTRSGTVVVNDVMMYAVSVKIPFGGVGTSGSGRYHGEYGFNEFSQERPIIYQLMWAEKVLEARYPPFSQVKMGMMRLMNRPRSLGFPRRGAVNSPTTFWRWAMGLLLNKHVFVAIIAILAYRKLWV